MVETNAYYAYCATKKAHDKKFAMSREEWKLALATRLIFNPYRASPVAP